jgi:hypothetical protein
MSTTNTNETSAITPAMTTEPQGLTPDGTFELPGKLPDYDPATNGGSGSSGSSTGN